MALYKRITYWRWYLPDKNQERVQIHNLLQELSQEKNIREVRTPSREVFTQEHNELFVQLAVQ